MAKNVMLFLVCLSIAACERSGYRVALQKDYHDLVAAGFTVERATEKDADFLRSILEALRKAKTDGGRFDSVTRIILYSPEAAQVYFRFHGAMNEGVFVMQKKDGQWAITHEYPAV